MWGAYRVVNPVNSVRNRLKMDSNNSSCGIHFWFAVRFKSWVYYLDFRSESLANGKLYLELCKLCYASNIMPNHSLFSFKLYLFSKSLAAGKLLFQIAKIGCGQNASEMSFLLNDANLLNVTPPNCWSISILFWTIVSSWSSVKSIEC